MGVTSSWQRNSDCCEWQGITCHLTNFRVISLNISNGGIISSVIEANNTLFDLHHLKSLNLAYNYFSSSLISPKFAQFLSLKHLNLSGSFFSGEVPLEIGQLSRLRTLDLSWNTLRMPSFKKIMSNLTELRRLDLGDTTFDSIVFPSITNLSSLTYLNLRSCQLEEELPIDILNLPYLEYLDVGVNNDVYSNFALYNWTSPLQYLDLSFVNLSSKLPSSPGHAQYNLLRVLRLPGCGFHGPVPTWVWNIPKLEVVVLVNNHFTDVLGEYLLSITSSSLEYLDLRSNKFTGNVNLYDIFSKLQHLMGLLLSDNALSVSTTGTDTRVDLTAFPWPEISVLALSSCNLTEFPEILQNQTYLQDLDLSKNSIRGEIPQWIFQVGNNILEYLDLSHNFLTGSLANLPWNNLLFIHVSSNLLHGPLPLPSATIFWFAASNNNFTGLIDPSICTLTSLRLLDLSNNNLGGEFTHCLGNISDDLVVLNLGSNNIHGSLPSTFSKCSSLQFLDLSSNLLQGLVPRSLANCTNLQLVNLRSNQLRDEFPYWLHTLPQIQVLDMSSNRLNGSITDSKAERGLFPMLQILDLSGNNFRGKIPATYIRSFRAMMNISVYSGSGSPKYMGAPKIREDHQFTTLATFDLSNNVFSGEIPDCMGQLVSIHGLNLSHNRLTGNLPASLGDLKLLNSMDLSDNMFTGKIPEEFGSLTSLGVFNVSDNQLVGPIPHVSNFNTFSEDSYRGNLGLYGFPLSNRGGDGQLKPEDDEFDDSNEDDFRDEAGLLSEWEIILMGYGCGTVVAMAWGYYMLSIGKPFWLAKLAFMMELVAVQFSEKHFGSRRRSVPRRN
ncbi:receptor-like protein 12 [Chenopodium quinoa]|uniref:receptor-like protein 12 n=1 Tax=Chenopodium quinoa TaxID=63459 RepID=UPI000B77D85D|nr:receptor-like protein 12 [Chenopodium quinoa]